MLYYVYQTNAEPLRTTFERGGVASFIRPSLYFGIA